MSWQKYFMITSFIRQYKFNHAPFIVLSHGLTMQESSKWLAGLITKKWQWMCVSNLHVLVRQFSAWKFYFVIGHSYLSPIGRYEPVPLSKDSCFVSHFKYSTSYPWCNECQYVSLLFQRSAAVLCQFIGFPQNNNWQNPCMTLISIGLSQSLHCLPNETLFWPISGIGVLKNKNVKKKWGIWRAEQLIFAFNKKYSSCYILLQLRNN